MSAKARGGSRGRVTGGGSPTVSPLGRSQPLLQSFLLVNGAQAVLDLQKQLTTLDDRSGLPQGYASMASAMLGYGSLSSKW